MAIDSLYTVTSSEQLKEYERIARDLQENLSSYLTFLRTSFGVCDFPNAIVWATEDAACHYIRETTLPAYTNDERIVMTPDIEVWRKLYLKQLEGYEPDDIEAKDREKIEDFYQNHLSLISLKQVFYHELAHHSDWFLDDFSSDLSNGIWFEEGMVEYISRHYLYSSDDFQKELSINQLLVEYYQKKYSPDSLEEFGQKNYDDNYTKLFAEYWRSFLVVYHLVETYGSFEAVFASYHEFAKQNEISTLTEWFHLSDF